MGVLMAEALGLSFLMRYGGLYRHSLVSEPVRLLDPCSFLPPVPGKFSHAKLINRV